MALTKEEERRIEQQEALIQELIEKGETSQAEIDRLKAQLKELRSGNGGGRGDQQLPPIDPTAAERRLQANRERRPDVYEARTEDGKRIGTSRRPGALEGLARARSRGEYTDRDEHGRRVRKQGAMAVKVTITRVHGNTGQRTVVAEFERGERVE